MANKTSNSTFLFDTNFFIRIKEHRGPKNLSITLDEYSDFFDNLRSLGTTFATTDSVLEELGEYQIKAWIKKTKFKIEKRGEIPDEIKEGVSEKIGGKLTTHNNTADYDLICFTIMNPDWTLVSGDRGMFSELKKIKLDAKFLSNWAFIFISSLRTGKTKHRKMASRELNIDSGREMHLDLEGFYYALKSDKDLVQTNIQNRERELINLIEGQKKGQRKPIKKKETVEVKPGIVSRFSNWVFIRAKSFSFSKSNEEKEKVGKVKGKIKKRINEVLKDLTLLKNKGCCLYFNNLHQIEDFTDEKITIISGEAEIRIPINLSVKDAEFMMAKHKMVKLLIPEFDVSKKEIEKIIQELCDDHILFTKKMKDPKSGRTHPFVGWSRFD